MHRLPAATLDEISELSRCSAVFLPADPARTGLIAFWNADGSTPPADQGSPEELTVVGSDVRPYVVPALMVPVRDALPVLTRARADAHASPSAAFWGAAGVLALQLVARGLLLPGLSPADHDAWRAGPLTADDLERIRVLAASMPPEAHAVPLDVPDRPGDAGRAGVAAAVVPRRGGGRTATHARGRTRHRHTGVRRTGPPAPARDCGPGPPMWRPVTTRAYGSRCGSRSRGCRRRGRRWRARTVSGAARRRSVPSCRSTASSDPAVVADAAEVWAGRLPPPRHCSARGPGWTPCSPCGAPRAPGRRSLPCCRPRSRTRSSRPTRRSPSCWALPPGRWPRRVCRCTGPEELTGKLTARAVIGPQDDGAGTAGRPGAEHAVVPVRRRAAGVRLAVRAGRPGAEPGGAGPARRGGPAPGPAARPVGARRPGGGPPGPADPGPQGHPDRRAGGRADRDHGGRRAPGGGGGDRLAGAAAGAARRPGVGRTAVRSDSRRRSTRRCATTSCAA